MKSKPFSLFYGGLAVFLAFITSSLVFSAEVRTWTDTKGRSLEGQLLKIDRDQVVLRLTNGKEVRLETKLLSTRDHEYLKETGGGEQLAGTIASEGKAGKPEKTVKIDTKIFKKWDEPFIFPDTEIVFDILESEHFMVMTERLNGKAVAETAERLWHGMVFQHSGFLDAWGDTKRAIFIIEDDATHKIVGRWYMTHLQATERDPQSRKIALTWPKAVGHHLEMTPELMEKYKVANSAQIFKVTSASKSGYRKVFKPFVTHCLSRNMVTARMAGQSGFAGEGQFAVITGHAYYKEIQLADETETQLISANYGSQNVQNTKGFKDGSNWAKELKKLVKKGKAKPSIDALYKYNIKSLRPEQLVLLYSFSYFMQGDKARLPKYEKMLERVNTSKQIPNKIEMAKIFGYATPEDLEKAWHTFILSSDFKD